MGMSVTFMAKIAADQAGSSCHIHFSLWHDGQNAFAGRQAVRAASRAPTTFRWFLGGWIAHVPDVMVFYAPTVNSYKRYVDGVVGADASRLEPRQPHRRLSRRRRRRRACASSAASPAPTAIRIWRSPRRSRRAWTASPTRSSRRPIFSGDIYAAQDLPHVPHTLAEATELFGRSDFAKRAFGDDVVEHYVHFFRSEQRAYDKAVTDWEIQRYFERI